MIKVIQFYYQNSNLYQCSSNDPSFIYTINTWCTVNFIPLGSKKWKINGRSYRLVLMKCLNRSPEDSIGDYVVLPVKAEAADLIKSKYYQMISLMYFNYHVQVMVLSEEVDKKDLYIPREIINQFNATIEIIAASKLKINFIGYILDRATVDKGVET